MYYINSFIHKTLVSNNISLVSLSTVFEMLLQAIFTASGNDYDYIEYELSSTPIYAVYGAVKYNFKCIYSILNFQVRLA